MAHISRKELKKDEVRDSFAHGIEAILSHQLLTTWLLVGVIVAALGVLGYRLYSQRETTQASAAFDVAMNSFQGRVITTGQPPAQPGEVTFADEKSKYTDAAGKFSVLAGKFPRTNEGKLAKYFAAISDEHINKDDDAKKLLQQLASDRDANFAAMGRYELAQLDDRTGQGDAAVKLYQQLIDKPAVFVPKPVVMLSLAEHYAPTNPTEAAKLFGQIKTDYPDTPIAEQADQGLSMLPGKS